MDEFETRLKSLPLRKPSADFGNADTLAKLLAKSDARLDAARIARRKYAMAAVIAAGLIFAFVALLPGSNDSQLLAQALDKIRAAKSLRFDREVRIDGKVIDVTHEFCQPPGLYRVEETGTGPGLDEAYAVVNVPADAYLSVNVEKRTAQLRFLSNYGDDWLADLIVEIVRQLDISRARPLEEKTIDGRRVKAFEIIEPKRGKAVVWVDPKTNDPVRVEISGEGNDGRASQVWSNIVVGEELDPQLFSFAVPNGYKLEPYNEDEDSLTSSPAGMVAAFLRFYTSRTQGEFPADVKDAYQELVERTTKHRGGQKNEVDAKLAFVGLATVTTTTSGEKGKDWEYYPGRTLGRKDEIVFWRFDGSGDMCQVVFADLHIERLDKQKLFELLDGS